MVFTASFKRVVFLTAFLFLLAVTVQAEEPNAVAFAGTVKKVILNKNKLAVVDPESKKRFTLIVDDRTKFSGWSRLGEIKKRDAINGKYMVTGKGL
jgi:hypothetical protein